MTRTTNARVAGVTFLLYIGAGIADMVISGQATAGADTAARLATIAQHTPLMGATILLRLLTFVTAVTLAVSLYALTRDEDPDLALLALVFRAGEGVIGALSAVRTVGLLSIATAPGGVVPADVAAAHALFRMGSYGLVAACCFAIGSTVYAYLFLRARSIPVALSWLGLIASVLLLIAIPAQLAGFVRGLVTNLVWIPMLVFELALAAWLIVKGVSGPSTSSR